ncbi:MAG: ATP-binding protein, partial [Promethearchaeota archaeon]
NVKSLNELANIIEDDPETGIDEFLNEKQRIKLAISLKTLGVGSTKLLFSQGDLINFDELLAPVLIDGEKKTPINVMVLKSLYTKDERDFFISVLVNELYAWMIRQGQAKRPRCIFFCDEIAPFIPSGPSKPGPKDPLILLFRQARKYGVQCFIASQSPKDIDYHAFEQFNTFFIGRITSQQSLKTIDKILEGLPDKGKIQECLESLPLLKSGQFLFLSPDNDISFALIFTRWLITDHRTLTLEDIKKINDGSYITPEQALRLKEEERRKREEEERRKREEEERRKREEEERRKKEEEERRKKEEEERRKKEEEERRKREEEERRKREEKRIREHFSNLPLKEFREEIEKPLTDLTEIASIDLTYRMIMHEVFERLKKISKNDFGIEFLKNLVDFREIPNEKSKMTYYLPWKTVLETKLARVEGDKLIFDFKNIVNDIIKKFGFDEKIIEPISIVKLEAIFYKLLHVPNLRKFLKE